MRSSFMTHTTFSISSLLAMTVFLSGCSAQNVLSDAVEESEETDTSGYLIVIEDDPDTLDFQCTSLYYTIAQNGFNRLVETEIGPDGTAEIVPSLAESWSVSDDGLSYAFHLREGVTFSNGSPLTSQDVCYSFTRLLTHPNSCNRDIVEVILGADELIRGEADTLEGFEIQNDLDFVITLKQPYMTFLAGLSMPGASIMDEETTAAAGDRFGLDPETMVGTGSFIITDWIPGERILMKANENCWMGPPACDGLDLLLVTDDVEIQNLFENGRLDILDLNDLNDAAEFYMHGDIYQDRLHEVQQVGITYIALNQTSGVLQDVRVRKALQLALNRRVLLDAAYAGRGQIENGIFPKGLIGHNDALEEIPYDPEAARQLLKEAGYPNGFYLTISARSSSTPVDVSLVRLAITMWEEIGVRAKVNIMDESEFMRLRKSGQLDCYAATWIADYDDPDNFIYTFYGSPENTRFRSLNYTNEEVINRVRDARFILNHEERMKEYQELEKIIVQDEASWIPLFSRRRYYVSSERLNGFTVSWNGSVKNNYRRMSIEKN